MCFSLAWLEQLFIWLIVIGAVIALIKLLIPFILSQLGAEVGPVFNLIMSAIKIVLWAIVLIFCVIVIFMLIGCLLNYSGGIHLPH